MILFKENLYGWGVCDIPMPRSSHDIFSDRRKKNAGSPGRDRRKHDEPKLTLALISGLITHDIPWAQTFFLMVVSLLSLLGVFFISKLMPEFPEKAIPKPLDVIINVLDEFDEVSPIHGDSVLRDHAIKKDHPVHPDEKKPADRGSHPVKQRDLIPRERQASYFEEELPGPLNRSQNNQKMRYSNAMINRDEMKPLSQQPDFMSILSFKQSGDEPVNIISTGHQQKKYNLKATTQVVKAPFPNADLSVDQFDISVDPVPLVNLRMKDQKKSTHERIMPVPAGRTDSFLTHKKNRDSTIIPANRTQKAPGRRVDPGSRVLTVPSVNADSFSPVSVLQDETVSSANHFQKNRRFDVVKENRASASDARPHSKVFADDLHPKAVPLPEPAQVVKNYSADSDKPVYQPPASVETEGQSQFPMAQNDPMVRDEDLKIKSRGKSASRAGQGNLKANKAYRKAHDLFDNISIDEIDPSYLVSLKELAVCTDPEEEFKLKTKLATFLDGPAKCSCDGILFFFKYPESGYTIQVMIYNPEAKPLKDRCSILRSAIDCLENIRVKGAD